MDFGTVEYLRRIQDIDLKSPKAEALYLGYKLSYDAFMVPYRMRDDGYILGVVGDSRRYYPLDAAMIERLQAQKLLPAPLPAYNLTWFDYLIGYLLWLVLAGIVVSLPVVSLLQHRRKQAAPFVQVGLAHRRAGNLDAAISAYSKALRRNPKLIDALMLRGDAYNARGDLARAVADFTRAIKGSQAPTAYFMRANAYLAGGNADAAIKDYTSALDRNGDFTAAYQNRAAAYERAGRPELAYADREAAARIAAASQASQPG